MNSPLCQFIAQVFFVNIIGLCLYTLGKILYTTLLPKVTWPYVTYDRQRKRWIATHHMFVGHLNKYNQSYDERLKYALKSGIRSVEYCPSGCTANVLFNDGTMFESFWITNFPYGYGGSKFLSINGFELENGRPSEQTLADMYNAMTDYELEHKREIIHNTDFRNN